MTTKVSTFPLRLPVSLKTALEKISDPMTKSRISSTTRWPKC